MPHPGAVALIGPAVEWRMRLFQTIHRTIAAIDSMGARRGEEHDHIRNLLGRAEPAHREAVPDVGAKSVGISETVGVPAVTLDQYRTRGDSVNADAVRHELQRPALGVKNQRCL